MPEKILVIGATGNVGAPLVRELVKRGEKVRAASRSAIANLPQGAEAVRLDLADPSTIAPALDGVDRIYAIAPAGTTDYVGALGPIIDAAAKRGVKIALQSAMGVSADDAIPLRQAEILLERSGVPYVILRPNWFADNFSTYWLHDVLNGEIRVPAAEGKSSFIDARDIAASAAAVLMTDRFDNQAFDLTGPEVHSYGEAAAMLSSAAGRHISYSPVDDDAFIAALQAAGVASDYAHLLAAIFYPVREGWTASVTDAVEKLTGKPPRSLQAYIAENALRFTPAANAA